MMEEPFTDETWLEFVVALGRLARSEHIGPEVRLETIDEACTQALDGSVLEATDLVNQRVDASE
jgi:hypothetical protein